MERLTQFIRQSNLFFKPNMCGWCILSTKLYFVYIRFKNVITSKRFVFTAQLLNDANGCYPLGSWSINNILKRSQQHLDIQ